MIAASHRRAIQFGSWSTLTPTLMMYSRCSCVVRTYVTEQRGTMESRRLKFFSYGHDKLTRAPPTSSFPNEIPNQQEQKTSCARATHKNCKSPASQTVVAGTFPFPLHKVVKQNLFCPGPNRPTRIYVAYSEAKNSSGPAGSKRPAWHRQTLSWISCAKRREI